MKKYHVLIFTVVGIPVIAALIWHHAGRKTGEPASIIIEHGIIITMNKRHKIIHDGAVVIRNDIILDVGSTESMRSKYWAPKIIDAQGNAVLPGLINGHAHAAMTLFRGVADDLNLQRWLKHCIFPLEQTYVTPDFVYWGTVLACLEMIRGGITTAVDMYFLADNVAQAMQDMGMRTIAGYTIFKEQDLEKTENFIQKWLGNALVIPAVAPHSIYSCSTEVLKKSKQLADQYKVPLITHLAETATETAYAHDNYHLSPVAYLASIGFLSKNVIAAHLVNVDKNDLKILKKYQVGTVHNPTSNAKLASGIAPVKAMLKRKIAVGLGTDSAASNDALSIFSEMKLAALLQKLLTQSARAINAEHILRMATIKGAEAIHQEHIIGSIEIGKKADIIIVQLNQPHLMPMYNVLSHLVYASIATDVQTVIVNGNIVMFDKKYTLPQSRIDQIYQNVKKYHAEILKTIAEQPQTILCHPHRVKKPGNSKQA